MAEMGYREERPTELLKWWEGGEILGGRDGVTGRTWLASSRDIGR
ncbi:ser/Thr-rich protein T10 in DGCR region-like protein [Corchorus olitorius]|uniref:Ser/Thr-rich protein T10 in DGCR region-like protein n=1 Tax=Corchorus olitorius TaxID=93759 RepID=A0A1R3GM45_9ROSI|nr:ser/Thr-rich protein T10 in DGCR region-like protein [Corchorus olitorius]